MSKQLKIACFGEVLWDVFPTKELLGGAPLNVALRLNSLGSEVTMISSVGTDSFGEDALKIIKGYGLSIHAVSSNAKLPTGTVTVTLASGQPDYVIDPDVAWDEIDISALLQQQIKETDALIFGSLALRNEFNRISLKKLLDASSYSVFDLNLRAPFYSGETIVELMKMAHFVKMNDEELKFICDFLNIDEKDMKAEIRKISEVTKTAEICITLGANGALLLRSGRFYHHPGFNIEVADTVGAGDSFLATLIYELLSNSSTKKALTLACAYGALVASKEGATCKVNRDEIESLIA